MQKTDQELVLACQKHGDLKAFEILIKRHQDKVRSVIYRFIHNTTDLDDVAQETFIKAFRSIKTYRSQSSFSTWLCRIAINSCKDKLKSCKSLNKVVSTEEENITEIASASPTPEMLASLSEEQKIVLMEIKKLPPQQQMALTLADIEDYSYEDIATILECPVGTVKSRIFNARKTLKEKLIKLFNVVKPT